MDFNRRVFGFSTQKNMQIMIFFLKERLINRYIGITKKLDRWLLLINYNQLVVLKMFTPNNLITCTGRLGIGTSGSNGYGYGKY